MKPEEIQGHQFLVALRGYDQGEVDAFLSEVALEHEALQREIDQLKDGAAAAAPRSIDEFEDLGASVAAVLRAAKESAAEITGAADAAARQVRDEAERAAAEVRAHAEQSLTDAHAEAESLRHRSAQETDEMRHAAAAALADARAEADRILREANERAGSLSTEAEARRVEAASLLADAQRRIAEADRHEQTLKARLREAADEISLAMLALGENEDEGAPSPVG